MPSLLASPSPQGVWVRAAALELRGRSGAATLLDPEHPLQLLELPAQPVTVRSLHRGPAGHLPTSISSSAVKGSIGSTTGCTITEKAPTRAFSWLKAPTSAFTFKILLRHYAKRALTPRSLNVKLGSRQKSQKGRAGWLA